MASLNQSFKEAVCIDEEVFFGPITDKERKIREEFETHHKNELNESSKLVEDDESQNCSVYKSFSVEESKYESFEDSLNEGIDKMPQEAKLITLRKSYDKIKSKRLGFYDSLEDVCSLASNIDKCSISCEVENESNLNSKHFVDDSLQVPLVPITSKNNLINDQVHFDDDSLAILECEATFSDSLEEVNVLENIEIEEINDIENISLEIQNGVFSVDQHSACPSKNLFDTSVEVICERKKDSDTADLEESFDEKNVLYDSLSNSDFKDILTDSLEDGKQLKEMLHLSQHATIEVENLMESRNNELLDVEHKSIHPLPNLFDTSVQVLSEKYKASSNISISKEALNKNFLHDSFSKSEVTDVSKDSLEESDKSNENLKVFEIKSGDSAANSVTVYPKQNVFDSINNTSPRESFNDKNTLCGSFSKSEVKDISKDSLDKSNENLSISEENASDNIKLESVYSKQSVFETPVQITSEKYIERSNNTSPREFVNDKNILCGSILMSGIKDISKDSLDKSITNLNICDNNLKLEKIPKQDDFETSVQIICEKSPSCFEKENVYQKEYKMSYENDKSIEKSPAKQTKIEFSSEQLSIYKNTSPSQNISDNLKNIDSDKSTISSDSHTNNKIKPTVSLVSDPAVTMSANDASKTETDTFSVESCHLKILNDDIKIDKDLKFQLHIEVTVGDKKCQIASQDVKIVPLTSQCLKSEKDCISTVSVVNPLSSPFSDTTSYSKTNENIMHLNNPELNLKNKDQNVILESSPGELSSNFPKNFEPSLTPNVTQRSKSSTACAKSSYMGFNDVSLLQALDLPDLSASFLNESITQSNDSLIPLNLYSPDERIQNFYTSEFKNKNKENLPEQVFDNENPRTRKNIASPSKVFNFKSPQSLQKCSSFKEKKTPGTKIPIRKINNFAVSALTPSKFIKPVLPTSSAEKSKKCQHSPHSVDSGRKTPGTTPNKIPHICKVRNTIFSKVPQIIPSKKYMNVQSPVAQYIKNNSGPVKTPGIDPVLRDCMNRLMESPHHLYQHTHASGSVKSSKKKA